MVMLFSLNRSLAVEILWTTWTQVKIILTIIVNSSETPDLRLLPASLPKYKNPVPQERGGTLQSPIISLHLFP